MTSTPPRRSGPQPGDRLTATHKARLGALVSEAHRFYGRLRRFAASLKDDPADSVQAVVRGRIDCVAEDRLRYAIQDLEAAFRESEVRGGPEP